jgi:hypothetical protein
MSDHLDYDTLSADTVRQVRSARRQRHHHLTHLAAAS